MSFIISRVPFSSSGWTGGARTYQPLHHHHIPKLKLRTYLSQVLHVPSHHPIIPSDVLYVHHEKKEKDHRSHHFP